MVPEPTPPTGGFFRSRSGMAFLGFLVVAGFFLLTEHTAHVFGALPFLFLLACPLLHLFMHGGGHGNHGNGNGETSNAPQQGGHHH